MFGLLLNAVINRLNKWSMPAAVERTPTIKPQRKVMVILPGIANAGSLHDAHGLLDRSSAQSYAMARGYVPLIIEVSGEAYENSPQVRACLTAFRADRDVCALYGFSGGGYNVAHVLAALTTEEKARLELVVVLGAAPHNSAARYRGKWELVWRDDPPAGHMAGPKALLAELPTSPATPTVLRTGKLAIDASGSLQNPAFSPDGTKLCFTRWRDRYNKGRADIGIFDLATGATSFLGLLGEANVSQPGSCWSSLGIIFSTDAYGPDRACYWDGRNVRKLPYPGGQVWEPSWGPDFYVGERHATNGSGPGQIVRISLTGETEPLTDPSHDCRQPCVSPDGRHVVFQEQIAGRWTLRMCGSDLTCLVQFASGTDATFSPDGKRIVFSDEAGRLAVIAVTGDAKIVPVAVQTPYSGAPSFSRDGRFIAYEGGPSGDDGGPPTAIYLAPAP